MIEIQPNGSIGILPCSVLRATDAHRSHVRAERLVVYPFSLFLGVFQSNQPVTRSAIPMISIAKEANQPVNWLIRIDKRNPKLSIGLIHIKKSIIKPLGWITKPLGWMKKPSMRIVLIEGWMKKPSMRIVLIEGWMKKPSIRDIFIDWWMTKPSIRGILIDWWMTKPFGLITLIDWLMTKPFGSLTFLTRHKTIKNVLSWEDNAFQSGAIAGGANGSISNEWIVRYRWPQRLKKGCVC